MITFPVLKTGAVLQYPASREVEHPTSVLTFVDGSEQRFRDSEAPLRRWLIRLDALDEQEMAALEAFLEAAQGRQESFAFVDPWDGSQHADCSLENDAHSLEFKELFQGRAMVVIRENRG